MCVFFFTGVVSSRTGFVFVATACPLVLSVVSLVVRHTCELSVLSDLCSNSPVFRMCKNPVEHMRRRT